jgi:hypothetical protein
MVPTAQLLSMAIGVLIPILNGLLTATAPARRGCTCSSCSTR